MKQLRDTNFAYPFQENKTPTKYGYRLIGEERFANEHTYSIMHAQGRMPSFSRFMEGKFGRFGTMPDRVKALGYDLDTVLHSKAGYITIGYDLDTVLHRKAGDITIVDIGGGRGEMLLEVNAVYPHLKK